MALLFTYDAGYFDKDEQGWCAHVFEVRIYERGDANGSRPFEQRWESRIVEEDLEAGVLVLGGCVIDLVDQKVRRSSTEELVAALPYDAALLGDGGWPLLCDFAGPAIEAVTGVRVDLGRIVWSALQTNENGVSEREGLLEEGGVLVRATEARTATLAQRRLFARGAGYGRFELGVYDWHGTRAEWRATFDWRRLRAIRRATSGGVRRASPSR